MQDLFQLQDAIVHPKATFLCERRRLGGCCYQGEIVRLMVKIGLPAGKWIYGKMGDDTTIISRFRPCGRFIKSNKRNVLRTIRIDSFGAHDLYGATVGQHPSDRF